MTAQELFNIGVEFLNEGRTETAMDVFNRVTRTDPSFAPVHLNMHNIFRSQGNLVKARECLIRFLNCPLTGMTVDSVPAIRGQLAEIEKQLNPQLQQQQQPR